MVNREAQKIPLFPLSTVLFPGGTIPLQIFEDRYHSMVQDCLDTDSKFGIVLIKEGQEVGGNAVPHKVGTLARITKIRKLPQNRLYLTAVGETRFNIIELIQDKAYLEGLVEIHNPPPAEDIEEQSLKEAQTAAFRHLKAIVSMNGGWVKKAQTPLPTDPDQLSFFLAQLIQGSNKVRQTILEEASIKKRIEIALFHLQTESKNIFSTLNIDLLFKFSRN
ncbi:MAG: LON peptidase substrate-binding domain-containing protein [Chloroflexota bacterium]|jgi:Lon protease-like protein|uniref:Lon N-terminal domain-containing protein n=1 Tax=marine metagenome TaxID=408172 RepID=A0A381NCY2_9ZZZZ|nr:peptidase S16 [Dehalococcoidia bacterium]MBV46182.1 peptidase S16 [Dehalococcoidia bacterium]MEC7914198.1 LON peptidase substrate-binding domain-containing protein [Chloroflexota bacterium]|tara:strand:+ start:13919 stop:14578 length:660 start_codon:yes stop_codon:yes gene_type:complete